MTKLNDNAVYEAFDETEYEYGRLLGKTSELPVSYEIADDIIQDQSEKRKSRKD